MMHAKECPITITTASNANTIIILQKCPCYTAPAWNATKGVTKK